MELKCTDKLNNRAIKVFLYLQAFAYFCMCKCTIFGRITVHIISARQALSYCMCVFMLLHESGITVDEDRA